MEEIWVMDKRKFLLKKDCNFITNRYIILYMVDFFLMYTLIHIQAVLKIGRSEEEEENTETQEIAVAEDHAFHFQYKETKE